MGVKERVKEFIKREGISEREFCKRIGVSTSYVNNIRSSIQPDKLKAIGEQFPELNPLWLMTGNGNMLGDNKNEVQGNNNTAVAGNGNNVTTNDIAGLIELQKGYQEMIREKDSQINRLISVIETLSGK